MTSSDYGYVRYYNELESILQGENQDETDLWHLITCFVSVISKKKNCRIIEEKPLFRSGHIYMVWDALDPFDRISFFLYDTDDFELVSHPSEFGYTNWCIRSLSQSIVITCEEFDVPSNIVIGNVDILCLNHFCNSLVGFVDLTNKIECLHRRIHRSALCAAKIIAGKIGDNFPLATFIVSFLVFRESMLFDKNAI